MTFEEYANTRLENGGMGCRLPHQLTIRGWTEDNGWGLGINQIDDNRESKDASEITGNATKIYSKYHPHNYVSFGGLVRCGDYIYIPDSVRDPEYDWYQWLEDGAPIMEYTENAHIIEYCISTGEIVDIDLGIGTPPTGSDAYICIIEERKIFYFDWNLDGKISPETHSVRIIDFSTQTVEIVLSVIRQPIEDKYIDIDNITVMRDSIDQIHLIVMCSYIDYTKETAGPNGENLLGTCGYIIYHKNYTIDSQWQMFDVIIDSQETDITSWDKYFDVANNRYLVIFGFREEGEGYGPIYLTHIVFDIETCAPPIEYDLISPWGEGWWDSIQIIYSSTDYTNGKLYETMYCYYDEDDIRDLEFDPSTGEFVVGTHHIPHDEPYPYVWLLPMSSREHVYFWDEAYENFFIASTGEVLSNYHMEVQSYYPAYPLEHLSVQCLNISNLLDSNGGGNPLVWHWNYSGSTLRAVDIVEGTVIFDMLPTGFVKLNGTDINTIHMGDSILIATNNVVLHPTEGGYHVGCTQIDFYLIT